MYSPPQSMATLTNVFRAASSAQGGAETPPSPSQLMTPVAIAPSVENQMEQLVQAMERGDPQQEALNSLNAQLWRVMASQLQLWSTAVDNHKDHIVRHYRYLNTASKKVKDLHDGSKDKFDKIIHDVQNKFKEMEDKIGVTQNFPAIVADEVQKHHAAFSLVGSEVARVQREINIVKDAVEQVAQAVVQWDSQYSAMTTQDGNIATRTALDRSGQVSANQVSQPVVQSVGSQAAPSVPGEQTTNTYGSQSQVGMPNALGSQSQAGLSGASGPNA